MKTRHVPLRKCIACHEMMPKNTLIRIVRTPDDIVKLDIGGRTAGRGAYLCKNTACISLAQKQHTLDRALKTKISAIVYEQLTETANQFVMGDAHEPHR